ncbi:hypothetical protein PLICRDRAFT_48082 [Plicaturopsis crispa FD-325 SS-3]|nr:hypothetical protein PLICRDRAFT_48082 [Plicaturopsis crispa FD-325 SS-3]
MPQYGIARLPCELDAHIVAHFRDSTIDLQIMSLVSKSWALAAQSWLFYDINLYADHDEHDRYERADTFARLIDGNPRLAYYAKTLNIDAGSSYPDERPHVDAILHAIGPKLVNVDHIRLKFFPFAPYHSLRSSIITYFPNLRTLRVEMSLFESADDMGSFLASFPRMECLQWVHNWHRDWTAPAPAARPKGDCVEHGAPNTSFGPCLKSLEFGAMKEIGSTLSQMIKRRMLYAVKKLTIASISDKDIAQIDNLLQYFGANLEHLALNSPSTWNNASYLGTGVISLLPNASLKSITFDNLICLRSNDKAWISSILLSVSSPHLETVSFTVTYSDATFIRSLPLEEIAQILTEPLFTRLKTVFFDLKCQFVEEGPRGRHDIQRRMPVLADVLQFSESAYDIEDVVHTRQRGTAILF